MPETITKPQPEDAAAYRCALSQFPTGVCIVSAAGCVDHPTPFAITVNSFVSVSLEPRLISWCIQYGSTSYHLWAQITDFAVSVLAHDQAHLCERYAQRDNHTIGDAPEFEQVTGSSPTVRDACATFETRIVGRHAAGDHQIIIAEVLAFSADPERAPLVYHQGAIRASS
jgi:flavin reductase (DIM6/NTAB) family NADH-FMN oxidoreductase RutF